jgi:hypothetical protein
MHVLVIFLDGIGLGVDDPQTNPFAVMNTPTLHQLSGGRRWLRDTPLTETKRAIFIPTDASLGIPGRPQSATGQGAIITGRNIPALIGEHYGPRPTQAIRELIAETNIFKTLVAHQKTAALINPFPPPFHHALARGKRLPSSIQYGLLSAGLELFTQHEYYAGEAISPDWTGVGWTEFLGFPDAPTYSPIEAGRLLAKLAMQRDFSFFSSWITDEIGHRGPLEDGVRYMETFDVVLGSLLEVWDDSQGLILIISDHGNMEDLSSRKHTENLIPTVAIGEGRHSFAEGFSDLTHITPGILRVLNLLLV